MEKNVDVACFNETWLKADITFNHKDFVIHRLDRPAVNNRAHGGVAICIRKGIKYKLLPHPNLEIIEAIGISIETKTGIIEIYSVYYPNTCYSIASFDSFRKDIKVLVNRRNSFFICGDLNSKHTHWNCKKLNKCGKILYDEMNFNCYIVENPPTPTYYSHAGTPSTLDIILTNNIHNFSPLTAHQDLSSDHLPVTFDVHINGPPKSTITKQYYRYDKADWKTFKKVINEKVPLKLYSNPVNLNSIEKIEVAIELLTSILLNAEEIAIPKESPKMEQNDLVFPDSLKLLIRLRNTRRRQWQRNRDYELKQIVISLNKKIQDEIQDLRNKRWDNNLSQISTLQSNQKLWRISKILRKKSKGIPTLRKNSDGPAYSSFILLDDEKAEALANNFVKVYTDIEDTSDVLTKAEVFKSLQALDEIEIDNQNIKCTSPREISYFIKNLRNKKFN